jgi:predicted lactoylglutathione lyase
MQRMPRMIFVNLPVSDSVRSRAFYEALGFTNNPTFSDETTACMVWSETIYVMLLNHDRWKTFTSRPIPSSSSSEVLLAINLDSRDDVDSMISLVAANGGTCDVNPQQDHGFMYSRAFSDPDGHVWEPHWMDPAAMPQS